MKVNVDVNGLKYLAKKSIENGTEKNFISIALEWVEQAESEMSRLSKLLKEKEGENHAIS